MTGEQTRDELLAMDDEELMNFVACNCRYLPLSRSYIMRIPNTDTPLLLGEGATAEDIREQLRAADTTRRMEGAG